MRVMHTHRLRGLQVNLVMYAIGSVAIVVGAIELLVFSNDTSAISFVYLYLAISTALSGVLYLGFGSLLGREPINQPDGRLAGIRYAPKATNFCRAAR
jgi:uncharacterized membrane protein HdeD (DUF308 family)